MLKFRIARPIVRMEVSPTTVTKFYDPEGYNKGYEAGKTDGFDDGYGVGYNTGHGEGRAEGFNTGYTEGQTAGYASGKSDGYTEGKTEGHTEGYASGKKDGHAEGYTEGHTEGYTEGHSKGVTAGKQAEQDAFWDSFQQNGTRANYSNAFYLGWDDVTYNPKYPILVKVNNTLNGTFSYSQITDTKVDIEVVSPGRIGATFFQATKLETIRKIILDENVGITVDAFGYCPALKNITFEGTIGVSLDIQRSTLLTKASMTNIIEHLSTTASGQTVTFSKVAKESAFTADEWAALIATRSNWTFSLV